MSTLPPSEIIADLEASAETLRPLVHLAPHGIEHPPTWQKHPNVEVLSSLSSTDQKDVISKLLSHSDSLLCSIGLQCLMNAKYSEMIDQAFAAQERCKDDLLYTMLIAAIGRLGLHEHMDTVEEALKEPSFQWVAIESLALLGSERAQDLLRGVIAGMKDDWDRHDVVAVLGEVGGEAVFPLLVEVLLNPNEVFPPIQGFAAQAIGFMGNPKGLEPLKEALQDARIKEKGRVIWGLGALAHPDAYDCIVPFLAEAPKVWWRAEALKSMAACDAKRAWPSVKQYILDADSPLRRDREGLVSMLQALGSCSEEKEALSLLLDTLEVALGHDSPSLDWTPPAFLLDEGMIFAGVILRAISEHLSFELIPADRPQNFQSETLVHDLTQRLAEELLLRGCPRAKQFLSA